MSQTFTPGTPANNALAVSQIVRDNFAALLSNHSGGVQPPYAVAGTPWFDGVNLKTVKERGSKAFGGWAMGAQVNLAVALAGEGQDGSTILADVRVQDNTLLGTNYFWDLTGGALKLYFLDTTTPAFFAGQSWLDPIIGQPVLWSADGILIGKAWETIPPTFRENVYATASPLQNTAGYPSTTLRAVDVEQDRLNLTIRFTPVVGTDHAILAAPASYDWSDFRDSGGQIDLLAGGVSLDPSRYIVVPFRWGGVTNFAVYACNGSSSLEAFANATYELRVRRPS